MSKNVGNERAREVLNEVRELLEGLGRLENTLENGTINNMSDEQIKEFVGMVRLKFGVREFTEEQLEKLVCSLRNTPQGQIENLLKHLQLFRNIQNFLKKKLN